MHPQLKSIADELTDATARAEALVTSMDEKALHTRPDPARWSAADCLDHLNRTTMVYLPLLDAALAEGRNAGVDHNRRYRRDLAGWLLGWVLEPPARFRTKTVPVFLPEGTSTGAELLAEFRRLQDELYPRLDAASGLDLNRLKIQSPFNARVSYNVYAAFRVLPIHQRRHLWQAERVRDGYGR